MKIIENKKYKIIYDRSASVFEKKLNTAIEDLEDHDLDITISDKRTSGFLAYIVYSENHKIPENVADEMEIRGLQIKCRDCPYLKRSADSRRKKFKCDHAPHGITFVDSPACNRFYEELIQMFYEYKMKSLVENYQIESTINTTLLEEK